MFLKTDCKRVIYSFWVRNFFSPRFLMKCQKTTQIHREICHWLSNGNLLKLASLGSLNGIFLCISCLHRCTLCYEWLPRQTSLIMSNCSNLPSNVQHIWPPWYGSRSHRPTFSGVGHLYIPSTMSLYHKTSKFDPVNAIAGPESTQICAILLISNLRNLQYLASLSIPMPQFEVLATSVYLAPWLNTKKPSLDPIDALLG